MGKNQHSKDRLFITATEWSQSYGGKKRKAGNGGMRPLAFDHCALSLTPYSTPAMLSNGTGVVFDLENIVPYIKQHRSDPVTGDPMTAKDIIRLNMQKNNEGNWHCPLTSKVFNASAHIVAIKTSGNVYSFNAVEELNLKARNFTDLLDGTAFVRSDIITLQDPQNPEIMAKRDISTFKHMQTIREESAENRKAESKTRHSAASESVMKEIERRRQEEELSGTKRKTTEEIIHGNTSQIEQDVMRFQSMQPLPQDVNPGQTATTGKVSASFTSSSNSRFTSNESRLATAEEIREARWKIMRQLGKKAMIQLQTTVGNINLEIHCDMATRCGWNFVTLCKQGYYDNTVFHRLVPGFIVQGGDPTGSGAGGESAFGNGQPFRDEFDTRIFHHDKRGILSMANSGPATNGSQFFLTLAATPHLDTKHSVFGRIVGGMQTLDRMEAIGADKKTERPLQEIKINAVVVYSDPLDEADQLLEDFIRTNMQRRLSTTVQHALPGEDRSDQPAEKRLRLTTSSSSK